MSLFHAGEGTRTPMPKALDPKSSASANSATPARSTISIISYSEFIVNLFLNPLPNFFDENRALSPPLDDNLRYFLLLTCFISPLHGRHIIHRHHQLLIGLIHLSCTKHPSKIRTFPLIDGVKAQLPEHGLLLLINSCRIMVAALIKMIRYVIIRIAHHGCNGFRRLPRPN